MVRQRTPQRVEEKKVLRSVESKFVGSVDEAQSLDDLTVEQLAQRYDDIEHQAQLMQGQILLAVRRKFNSDNDFGDWIKKGKELGLTLCSTTSQHRSRLMNLARYFKDREMVGISVTVAYEISAPANQDIADSVYEYTKGKNLKLTEVKEKIAELKNQESIPSTIQNKRIEAFALANELQTYKDVILDDVKDLPNQDAIRVLKSCLKELQEKKDTHVENAEIIETSQAS